MKFKVVFRNSAFRDLEIDNVDELNAADDIFYMGRDGKVIFTAPKDTVLYITELKADTEER